MRRLSHWWTLIFSLVCGAIGLWLLFEGQWLLSLVPFAFYFVAIHRWVSLADDQP
jgi:hypothetical protein